MQLKLWTLAAAAFVAVVGISFSIGFMAMQEWWEPWVPALYLGAALLVLYAVVSAVWFRITREEIGRGVGGGGESAEERGFKRLAGLTIMVLFGVFALFLAALWNFDLVRGWSLKHLAEHEPLQTTRALDDPSTKVRRIACKLLFEEGLFPFESRLHAALDQDPEAALACLTVAAQRNDKGHRLVAGKLVEGWRSAMLEADDRSTDRACRVAQYLPEIARIADGEPGEAAVLQCALGARSEVVRACCSETLAARGKLLDHFADASKLPDEHAIAVFGELVLAAFDPARGDATTQATSAKLGMEKNESQQFVIEVGCRLFQRGFKREVIRGFIPVLESEACGLNQQTQLFFSEVEPWPLLCEEVQTLDDTASAGDTMCKVIRNTVTDATISRASGIVDAATRAMYLQATAATMEENQGKVSRMRRREDPMDFSNIEIMRFYETKDTDYILGRRVPRECFTVRNDMMEAHRRGGLRPNEIKYDSDPSGCTPEGLSEHQTLEGRVRNDFGAIGDILSGRELDDKSKNRGGERESTRLKRELRQKYSKGQIDAARKKVRSKINDSRKR